MKININALTKIYISEDEDEVTDSKTLYSLDNLTYSDSSLSDYIHDGDSKILKSIDVVGGYIAFKYDQKTGLKIITEYESATKLSKKQLSALEKYTIGQWEEGVGESFNNDLCDTKSLLFSVLQSTVESIQLGSEIKESPIFAAIKKDDLELVKKLVSEGAFIDVTNFRSDTPLDIAIYLNNDNIASYLIKNDVRIEGYKNLRSSVVNGMLLTVEAMLKRGLDVNTKDDSEKTSIMWASNRGNLEIVNLLIKYNSDMNFIDNQKRTALMYSISYPKIFEILLKNKADTSQVDVFGKTILDIISDDRYSLGPRWDGSGFTEQFETEGSMTDEKKEKNTILRNIYKKYIAT